jgi:hypothetical protein
LSIVRRGGGARRDESGGGGGGAPSGQKSIGDALLCFGRGERCEGAKLSNESGKGQLERRQQLMSGAARLGEVEKAQTRALIHVLSLSLVLRAKSGA